MSENESFYYNNIKTSLEIIMLSENESFYYNNIKTSLEIIMLCKSVLKLNSAFFEDPVLCIHVCNMIQNFSTQ